MPWTPRKSDKAEHHTFQVVREHVFFDDSRTVRLLISTTRHPITNDQLLRVVFILKDEEICLEGLRNATGDVSHRQFTIDHLRWVELQPKQSRRPQMKLQLDILVRNGKERFYEDFALADDRITWIRVVSYLCGSCRGSQRRISKILLNVLCQHRVSCNL
jgi:hypothetical protein